MNGPTNPVGFDNAQTASSYVAFAATLAAIVFAAIILLLSNPPTTPEGKKKEIDAHIFNGLLVAFASLSIAAFLFILIAGTQGEPQDQTLAFLLAIGGDIVLSLAVLQLMLSLSWCFDAYGIDTSGVKWLVSGLLFPIGVYMVVSIGDYIWDITSTDWKASQYFWPLVLGGLGFLVTMPLGGGWAVRFLFHHVSNATVYTWAIAVSAILSVVIAVVFGIPDPPGKILGDYPFQADFPYPLGFWLNFPLMFFVGLCETLYIIGLPKHKQK